LDSKAKCGQLNLAHTFTNERKYLKKRLKQTPVPTRTRLQRRRDLFAIAGFLVYEIKLLLLLQKAPVEL